jgi:phosphoribosylanthranilate isomerase
VTLLVKICGLTREQDVDAAVAAGADLVGFVLDPSSPRAVTAERARELAARVPAGVRTVAVGADAEGLDLAQLYDPAEVDGRTIVATRGGPPDPLPDGLPVLLDLPFGSRPRRPELEAHWRVAATVRAPVVLAGSLDPANVAAAVRTARPWAVDTSRGVETAPGVKDADLIELFVRTAKAAS